MPDQRIFELTEQPSLDNDAWLIMDKSGWQTARRIAPGLVAGGGGSTLPVADTQTIVKGSVDDTKLLRFEVDGFTAGATRVLTPPNADATIAGLEVAQTFTAAQKINVNSTTALFVEQDGVIDNAFIVDTTNGRVGLRIQPETVLHYRAPSSGTYEFRIDGPSGTIGRIGFWETTVANPTDGGYYQYEGALNALQAGVRDGSTTDRPVLQISKTSRAVVVGIETVLDAAGTNSVAIGRLSTFAHANVVVIGTSTGSALTSPAASTISMGIAGTRLLVINSTGAGFGTDTPATQLHAIKSDAVTAAITNVAIFGHNSSGTPAANFATGIAIQGESSTTADQDMARLAAIWDVATHASRSAALQILISGSGGEVDAAKFDDDATAGNTRMLLYDVDNGQLERVSVGVADSGGVGFKVLRIAN